MGYRYLFLKNNSSAINGEAADDNALYRQASDSGADQSVRTSVHRERVEPLELGSTKARLYIDCAQPSDAGQYTCVSCTDK